MADSKSPEDRSMSEILASIRRIVSDEEKARRDAETSRRTHEKEAGESVLTLTPDMHPTPNKGESLSEALGVAMHAGVTPQADTSHAPAADKTELQPEPAPTEPAAPGAYELPALELCAADLVQKADETQEPLVLRRSSLRREAEQGADTPAPVKRVVEAPENHAPAVPPVEEQPAAEAIAEEPVQQPVDEPIAGAPAPEHADAQVREARPALRAVEPTTAAPEPEPALEPEPEPEVELAPQAVVERAPEPEPEPETLAAPEPVIEPAPIVEPVEDVAAESIAAENITAEPVAAQATDADEDGLLDDDVLAEPLMTEAEVEAIVRRIVREELQGPIGQQISRKVKRLIKDEIRKALYDDDSLI